MKNKRIYFPTKTKVKPTNIKKVHFMGIGGSGTSAIASLAAKLGFEVTGCDLQEDTAYSEKLKKLNIKTFVGHSDEHIKDIDALIVTPAVFFENDKHPEVKKAKELGIIIMTSQEFMGKYLQEGKSVICVAGTHGKSTTTGLLSLVFEKAGLDPSVFIGATVTEWKSNSRESKSKLFICEADEFYNNFLNYHPETIILNNIEFDHPDFFKSEEDVIKSFSRFVENLTGQKSLIFNQDSEGISKLFEKLGPAKLNDLNLIGYSLKQKKIDIENSIEGEIVSKNEDSTVFKARFNDDFTTETYTLKIPGDHNVYNALGVIAASKLYGIEKSVLDNIFANFEGVGRRLELLGEKSGIKVYDDYGHHPTALKATIDSIRQKYPNNRIWAIVEAHSFSRTKALLDKYLGVFDRADKVIVGPIFKARDNSDFGVSGKSIVEAAKHKDARYIDSIDKIITYLKKEVTKGDVILVMGAGESYKWSREILKNL